MEHSMEDNDFALLNASASFEMLEGEDGPAEPSAPLRFDPATIGWAIVTNQATLWDPATRQDRVIDPRHTFLVYAQQQQHHQPQQTQPPQQQPQHQQQQQEQQQQHDDSSLPARAYWVGGTIRDCIFGHVKICTILHRRPTNGDGTVPPWEITERLAAVKVLSRERIRARRHREDPLQEIAALQYIAERTHPDHPPNLVHTLDVLEDKDFLYIFMPYYAQGSLHFFVDRARGFPEHIARFWFCEILKGLAQLQQNGVCHRDMSLENVVIDDTSTRLAIIDFGMALRVPFHDDATGGVTDVAHGSLRRLMLPSGTCGKLSYMSPEILHNVDSFDGFAVDLWGAAVMLFVMLVGQFPWVHADRVVPAYRFLNGNTPEAGRLQDSASRVELLLRLVQSVSDGRREISPQAADLLQHMLRDDPRQRLSLSEVQEHPWVFEGFAEAGDSTTLPNEPWRQGR